MRNYFVILLLAISSTTAIAGIYFEPYFGTSSTTTEQLISTSISADITDTIKDSSSVWGAKVGYSVMLVNGGFEYTSLTDTSRLAIYVSLDLPVVPFMLTGRSFISTGYSDEDLGYGYKTTTNTGVGFGLTFTAIPYVNLTFDYNTYKYEAETDDFSQDRSGVTSTLKFDITETVLSIGVPF